MDIVGDASPLVDAEIIAAAIDIMRVLGLSSSDVKVRVSDRKAVTGALKAHVGLVPSEMLGVLAALDKHERNPNETLAILKKTLNNDDVRVERAMQFAEYLSGPSVGVRNLSSRNIEVDDLGQAFASDKLWLDECVDHLREMGLGDFVEIDFRIVRGLAYYTGVVFELFDAGRSLRAICGGGRYDDLVKQISGVDLPCVGFGMGDVVLGELLKDRQLVSRASKQLDAFIVAITLEDRPFVLSLAHQLRDEGYRIEYALRPSSIRKQIEMAATRGARYAVIVGPEERSGGKVKLRNLQTKDEQLVDTASLVTRVKE
jgi:histidyl-tRNA synthetase